MDEERMRILKMLEEGKITAEEAARLLEALEASQAREETQGTGKPRWFRIRVTDMKTGKSKVNLNIPLGMVQVGMRLGGRFAPSLEGFDIQEVVEAIRTGTGGKIVDVDDEEKGERVEIVIE